MEKYLGLDAKVESEDRSKYINKVSEYVKFNNLEGSNENALVCVGGEHGVSVFAEKVEREFIEDTIDALTRFRNDIFHVKHSKKRPWFKRLVWDKKK